ncbi:MAG TPA: response regulator [Stellaceae bacterium]|nr:response regulator [Stellaceae bacterium]
MTQSGNGTAGSTPAGNRPPSRFRAWFRSLTARMVLLVLIAVAPAIGIQAYNEYTLRQSREAEIRNHTIQITRQFGAEIGELKEGAHQFLVAMSRLPAIERMDPAACSRTLAALDRSLPNYSVIGVADAQGTVTCISDDLRATSLASVRDMAFFKRAMARGGLAVGTYWVDPKTGQKTIHFGLRFSAERGGPVTGVVFAGLDLDWLIDQLKERGLTPTQSILIADRKGNIIARLPHPEQLVGKNMAKGHAKVLTAKTTGWEEAKGVDGVVRIFGYVPPALPPGGFFLSAGESKDAAFAAIAGATQRGIALILAGLLLAASAAWFVGRAFIRRPIEALLQAAHQWRRGNYEARAQLKDPHSEIGQLAEAFNAMAGAVAARHAAQRTAEERLRELNTTLEDRVEQRTRELANANRAKSQFLANMSHEIRTPMNGIIGMMELLSETALAGKQRRYLETGRRSADTLLAIINGILDLSKIEAGKLELENREFNLRELVEDVIDLFNEMATRKGLELACFLNSNLPTALVGDPGRLRQILTNLLGNAIKFTERGEVVVTVSLIEANAEAAFVQFEVRDTGIGISPHDQKRIFGTFSQADGSMRRRYGGTGLGLSIAKELCEMMGGSVSVSSKPGVGSVFRFSVRLGQQQAGLTRVGYTGRLPRDLRVLVVDDNNTNREILQGHLTNEGVHAEAVGSGAEAIDLARRAVARGLPFAIALIDMNMPDMNGLELARAIKTDPALAAMQLVMLTSLGQDLNTSSDYLARRLIKPVRRSELLDAVRALTEAMSEPPAEASEPSAPEGPWAGTQVLLVEDSPVNLEVAVNMLENCGCTVETASNGRDALAMHAACAFDVIFMDCQMPEMDGFEATSEIRQREANGARRTPIVALTANAIAGDREKCLREGMDGYLSKPFTRGQLCSVLEIVLAKPGSPGAGTGIEKAPVEPAPALPAGVVLDEAALTTLRQLQRAGRPDIVKRTIDLYLENAPRLLKELQEGAETDDVAALGRASHTLKSNSANVGAVRLAALCNDLETLARSGLVPESRALVATVVEEYAAVNAALSVHVTTAA